MPVESLKLMSQLFQNHCPMPIARQFLELTTGRKFPKNSMKKLHETVLMRKHNADDNESTVETLMHVLNNDNTLSCVCNAGIHDESKQLV